MEGGLSSRQKNLARMPVSAKQVASSLINASAMWRSECNFRRSLFFQIETRDALAVAHIIEIMMMIGRIRTRCEWCWISKPDGHHAVCSKRVPVPEIWILREFELR
jgi:hypothetical protein